MSKAKKHHIAAGDASFMISIPHLDLFAKVWYNTFEGSDMMAKGREYMSHYPENPPEWYWVNGLHDAGIIGVESYEFSFDYNKFAEEKSNYNRNLLILKIDAKGAFYDNFVEEIRLYNYKFLTPDISLEYKKTIWWLADRLTVNENYYILEIDLQVFDAYPKDFTFKIKFEKAEVKRK